MQQWYNCPRCRRVIKYGANPCPNCKCSFDWSQQEPNYLPPQETAIYQPLMEARQHQSFKPISKKTYFILFIIPAVIAYAIYIPSIILTFYEISINRDMGRPTWPVDLAQGLLFFTVIVNCVFWYKAWARIQDGNVRTTPGKAIGFLFIPFFNLYWIFQAIWGFSKDYNLFIERHSLSNIQLPEGLFLTLSILGLLCLIPVVGLFISLIAFVINMIAIGKICDSVNFVTNGNKTGLITGRDKIGFISKARTGLSCTIQIIGGILWLGCGLLMFVWALNTLFTAFGVWTIFVGLILFPVTYAASIFIIWFSTGKFPFIWLVPYILSWVGMYMMMLGGLVKGKD